MAVSPSVLLMDEPASALDPISTAKVEELIHELKKDYTIVIVTHNMQQAARVSDKTAFFYLGEMVEYGDTKRIFTNPENCLLYTSVSHIHIEIDDVNNCFQFIRIFYGI